MASLVRSEYLELILNEAFVGLVRDQNCLDPCIYLSYQKRLRLEQITGRDYPNISSVKLLPYPWPGFDPSTMPFLHSRVHFEDREDSVMIILAIDDWWNCISLLSFSRKRYSVGRGAVSYYEERGDDRQQVEFRELLRYPAGTIIAVDGTW